MNTESIQKSAAATDTSSANKLGSRVGSLVTSALSSSLMGGSASASAGASAAGAAASMAAQSLLKAYSNKSQNSAAGVSGAGAITGSSTVTSKYADITSSTDNRSPELYRAVLDSLDVEDNPRYAVNKTTGSTYCNVYMLDATEAMGAAIPRYTDKDTGVPSNSSNDNAIAMNANRISDWLNKYGEQYGWYEVTAEQAQALANRGSPAVTTWRNNSGGHGHVQVVSPSESGTYDPEKGVAIAQAGTRLRNYTYITNIYSSRMKEVQYFAHR